MWEDVSGARYWAAVLHSIAKGGTHRQFNWSCSGSPEQCLNGLAGERRATVDIGEDPAAGFLGRRSEKIWP